MNPMIKIDQNKHIELIQSEYLFQVNEFNKLLKKTAAKMFVDNQLYLCRYQGFDEVRGNIIVKFEHNICNPPRKNENLQCFVSEYQDNNVKNWGGLTYEALRSKVTLQFESKTIFFSYESDYTIVGLSGVKLEDVGKYQKNSLLFLAPADPPLNYIFNLLNYVKETNPKSNEVLDIEIGTKNWNPEDLVVDENIVTKLQTDFIFNENIIIQGPPGTGKTHLMALLCSQLLKSDFRILVTALTNRALGELAEKEHLQIALGEGKIYKSALTADESKNKKTKGLKAFKSMSQQKPQMLLSTYYVMSQLASKATIDNHFDYIIIEEASQAFLATIALAKKMGKKCIIIGDIKQLEPIFHKEFSQENQNNYYWMVRGLKGISYYLRNTKQYILTNSYRLTPNSVVATNSFYNGKLKSKSNAEIPFDFSEFPLLKQNLREYGGTSLKIVDKTYGKLPTNENSNFIINIIKDLQKYDPKCEIAVLAFNRDTIRFLQKEVYSKCLNTELVLVETIDRIQGLTTDYCIFFIPEESIPFALQVNRFNVSTSRARYNTLIIASKEINYFINLNEEVQNYFSKIKAI